MPAANSRASNTADVVNERVFSYSLPYRLGFPWLSLTLITCRIRKCCVKRRGDGVLLSPEFCQPINLTTDQKKEIWFTEESRGVKNSKCEHQRSFFIYIADNVMFFTFCCYGDTAFL